MLGKQCKELNLGCQTVRARFERFGGLTSKNKPHIVALDLIGTVGAVLAQALPLEIPGADALLVKPLGEVLDNEERLFLHVLGPLSGGDDVDVVWRSGQTHHELLSPRNLTDCPPVFPRFSTAS